MSGICQHGSFTKPCPTGRRFDLPVPLSWGYVVRSMVLGEQCVGPDSLHRAEATGSKPVLRQKHNVSAPHPASWTPTTMPIVVTTPRAEDQDGRSRDPLRIREPTAASSTWRRPAVRRTIRDPLEVSPARTTRAPHGLESRQPFLYRLLDSVTKARRFPYQPIQGGAGQDQETHLRGSRHRGEPRVTEARPPLQRG